MKTKAAALVLLLLPQGIPEAVSAEDKLSYPWDGLYSPHFNDQTYLGIAKDTRWDRCNLMIMEARVAAGTVHFQRNNPPEDVKMSDPEIIERLQSMHTQEDNINDAINKKIIEIAFAHWSAYQDAPISKGAVIEYAAWEWCIKQPAELFYEL